MSSFDAALFPTWFYCMCFSDEDKSVVAEVSPAFKPSASAAAYFYLSSSVGTPLLSLISWVIFIMSKFFKDKQFLMQN